MPPNILVVDDHESMRRRIRSLLKSAGIGICAEAATSPPPVPERTATWYAVILP
jgi:CheY-like chemotaxis protein